MDLVYLQGGMRTGICYFNMCSNFNMCMMCIFLDNSPKPLHFRGFWYPSFCWPINYRHINYWCHITISLNNLSFFNLAHVFIKIFFKFFYFEIGNYKIYFLLFSIWRGILLTKESFSFLSLTLATLLKICRC